MALVIEDGTAKANATSFVTIDEYKAFATARGFAVPLDAAIEANAIKAVDYIVSREREYGGDRLTNTQALPFPRTGQYVLNVLIADGSIPVQVKALQFGIMKAIADGIDLFPTSAERALQSQRTGPLFKQWFDNDITPTITFVDALIRPLLSNVAFLAVRRI
jgi:hypothetical protein